MRLLKKIPLFILAAVNLLLIAAMLFCAYTSCLPPQDEPQWSYFGLLFPVFLVANVVFVLFWLIVKWKWAVLPVAGLVLCASSVRAYFPVNIPHEPPEGSIKVLSYNVMSFAGERKKDNSANWEENPILKYLLESGADIICLQEANKAFVDRALDSITHYYPYHYRELKADNYMVCFSKYPIDSAEEIKYPTKSNYTFAYRICVEKDTLLVIHNHLESYRLTSADKDDYKSIIKNYKHPEANDSETKYQGLTEKISTHDSIRGLQVDSVMAYLEANQGKHILLCGDLNATPVSYIHHRLTSQLDDAYTRSGNGPGISYHRYGMYFRLDHIMVSPNIKAYGAKVDSSIKDSDHYPIYCFIKLD